MRLRGFVIESRGEPGWTELQARLQPADMAIWGELLLTSSWYPIGLWNRSMDALVHDRPKPSADIKDFGFYISRQDFHSLFRVLIRAASADFVLGRTGSVWTRYFDAGSLQPAKVAERHWQIVVDAPTGEELAPSRLTCLGVGGWVEHALALTGEATGQVIETHCRFNRAPHCTFDVTW